MGAGEIVDRTSGPFKCSREKNQKQDNTQDVVFSSFLDGIVVIIFIVIINYYYYYYYYLHHRRWKEVMLSPLSVSLSVCLCAGYLKK